MQRPGHQRHGEVPAEPAGRVQRRGRLPEEEAAAAEDPLHQPAAPGAGGHLPEEPLPRHEHPGGDRCLDQPHRGAGQGVVQEPARQVEEAGAEPAGGAVQKRLRRPVQRTHAAVRRRVHGLLLQQLGHQEPGQQPAVRQELPLLQLHERQPAVLPAHVLAPQLPPLHEHGLQHGALRGGRRSRRGAQQPRQPQQPQWPQRAQLGGGGDRGRVPLRHHGRPLHVQRHLQLQPGQPAAQGQAARQLRLPGGAEPRVQPKPVPVCCGSAGMKTNARTAPPTDPSGPQPPHPPTLHHASSVPSPGGRGVLTVSDEKISDKPKDGPRRSKGILSGDFASKRICEDRDPLSFFSFSFELHD